MSSQTKRKSAYQLRRQSLRYQIEPDRAQVSPATAHLDEVTSLCRNMMHFGHLSKKPQVKDADITPDTDQANQQQPDFPSRSLRRRSNSFDKLIRAFRLKDELKDDEDEEEEHIDAGKQDSITFEPVHVPPPNRHVHSHHRHSSEQNKEQDKGHHPHDAMLLCLVKKSCNTKDAAETTNPFDSTAIFDKLNASTSSIESLSLDDLCSMATMDVVRRDTEREIRSHLDQNQKQNEASIRATLQTYHATNSISSSGMEASASFAELSDGFITLKSEIPNIAGHHTAHHWQPHRPSLHKKYSACSA